MLRGAENVYFFSLSLRWKFLAGDKKQKNMNILLHGNWEYRKETNIWTYWIMISKAEQILIILCWDVFAWVNDRGKVFIKLTQWRHRASKFKRPNNNNLTTGKLPKNSLESSALMQTNKGPKRRIFMN